MANETKIVIDCSEEGAPPVEVPLTDEEQAQLDADRADGQAQAATRRFETDEDGERLRLIKERAAEDPAYAALADIVLSGKGL